MGKVFSGIFIALILVLGGLAMSCNTIGFDTNGQRIYYTASSSSGNPITYSGSFSMMHPLACVNCHGPDGKGGRVRVMMQSLDVPDITWSTLTGENHQEGEGMGQEEHPPYTEETIKNAITKGVNPAGERLDDEMPRWRMQQSDLNDLIDFLKTLE